MADHVEDEDHEGDGGIADDDGAYLRGEVQSEATGEDKKEEGGRDEWCVKTRDFGVEAGDVGNRKEADEEDGHERNECHDLMRCFVAFGLCSSLVLNLKYHGTR